MPNFANYFAFVLILFVYMESFRLLSSQDSCAFCRTGFGWCFTKHNWCDRRNDCVDGRDEKHCNSVFPNCVDALDSCDSGRCIPKYWICDGEKDCADGSDEQCSGGRRVRPISLAKTELRKWMLRQRSNGWGWEKDTPRAIVAMYLMDPEEYSSGKVESKLAAKELEAQLSFDLFRNYTKPLDEVKIAHHIHAMLATCNDPKHFHGLNMASILYERISKLNFIRPITLLALCNAGLPLAQSHIAKLKDIITKPNDPIWIDTKALATMALICAVNKTNDRSLNSIIFNSLVTMKSLQNTNGSFGDARTSALIMQALIGNKDYNGWNLSKAILHIAGQRRNDSNGMLTNYLIMPLLSDRTLIDLGRVNCSYKNTRNLRNLTLREILEEKMGKKIRVQISILLGDDIDVSYVSTFRVPVNTSLFTVMKLASEMDKRYSFQWKGYQGRKYIYCMSSKDNDPELLKYWTLYKKMHQEGLQLIEQDVEDIYPNDKDHYVFWYKTILEEKIAEVELGNNSTIF